MVHPSTLCVEITESPVVMEPETGERALSNLRDLGLKAAIDDLGVGVSSVKRLVHSMRFDVIRLDWSFVAAMEAAAIRQMLLREPRTASPAR